MVVVHVASDAFVGTVLQAVTVNINHIVACCNLSVASCEQQHEFLNVVWE